MRGVAGVGHGVQVEKGADPRLSQATHEFEAQMMKELIRPMTERNESDGEYVSGGALGEFAGEALGQSLSRSGGFGIADMILATVSRNDPRRRSGSDSAPFRTPAAD